MTAAQFFVLHILYVFLSSNKTENICGNPYEANIGKSRVNKDKVIKSPLCDLLYVDLDCIYQRKLNMFLNMFYKGEVT